MPLVVILYWDHPWSAVAEPARAMSQALTSLGVEVRPMNIMDMNLNIRESVLQECLSDSEILNCDIVISMGAPPLSIRVEGKWLFEILGKAFLVMSVDALFYDYCRVSGVAEFLDLAKISRRLGFIWGDSDSAQVVNQLTRLKVHEIQFGGFFEPVSPAVREKRIAVIGSMGWELANIPENTTFEELILNSPPQLVNREQLLEFAEAIERPGPVENISKLAMDVLGLRPEFIYTYEMAQYLSRLDAFQKRRRRRQTVAALNGIPIDFFGPNWEPYTEDFKDCRYLGSVPYQEISKLCRQYRVLLDFNPGFGHALHDRVYTGVGNGCRVMTNSCRAIADLKLPEKDAIIPYDVSDPNLADAAHDALNLPVMEPASLLAFRGENSWLARMDELLFATSSE